MVTAMLLTKTRVIEFWGEEHRMGAAVLRAVGLALPSVRYPFL